MMHLDVFTTYFMSGLTYIAMPIVSWVAMYQERSRPVALWCLGGVGVGLGLLLIGLRGSVPDIWSYLWANALICSGELARIQALRIESKKPLPIGLLVLFWAIFALGFEYIRSGLQDAKLRLVWVCSFHACQFFYLAILSFHLSRQPCFRVARWISAGYLILSSLVFYRLLEVCLNWTEFDLITSSPLGLSLPILGLLSAIVVHFGYIGMSLDRSIMQIRLQESELAYRILADAGPSLLRVGNTLMCCEYVNAAWSRFIGLPLAAALKQDWLQAVHPMDAPVYRQACQAFLANREAFSLICRIRRADGDYRWIDEHWSPRYNAQGEFAGFIACGLDITQRKLLEEASAQSKLDFLQKIAQLDRQRSMGLLSASLGHELNQPLATILLNAQCLRDETLSAAPDLPMIRTLAEEIIQSTRHGEQVVQHIQRFIKPHEMDFTTLDLQALLRHSLELMKKEAQRQQVKFTLPKLTQPAWVAGDFILLSQVLVNILRNAIEALKQVERREIVLELNATGQHWHLVIWDSGPGLSPQVSAHIATAFFTTKDSGLGMGLSISKAIIEQHQGELLIGNHAQGGARFEIVLPMI